VAPSDPWLSRQNAALKLKGHGVTLDVAGGRLRLRATMPPKPEDPPGCEPKQQRISTGFVYPAQASESLQLAEQLGNELERHRLGLETFNWEPWLPKGKQKTPKKVDKNVEALTGQQAVRLTREWWGKQRTRGPSEEDSWKVDYQDPLAPLLNIDSLMPEHLVALVETTKSGSRSRRRASQSAATLARALGWSDELIAQLRELGKGYSSANSQVARDLPSKEMIEEFIDHLSPAWQWPAAVTAAYGCRPHEALLFAQIMPTGLLRVSDGKTGARQSLALPNEWVERWSLHTKRLPAFNNQQSRRAVGALMGQAFRRHNAGFKPYDLRHAWAVRTIHNPKISPSLAAKSMGHSLAVHSSVYQRWFDAHEMELVQNQLSLSA